MLVKEENSIKSWRWEETEKNPRIGWVIKLKIVSIILGMILCMYQITYSGLFGGLFVIWMMMICYQFICQPFFHHHTLIQWLYNGKLNPCHWQKFIFFSSSSSNINFDCLCILCMKCELILLSLLLFRSIVFGHSIDVYISSARMSDLKMMDVYEPAWTSSERSLILTVKIKK